MITPEQLGEIVDAIGTDLAANPYTPEMYALWFKALPGHG